MALCFIDYVFFCVCVCVPLITNRYENKCTDNHSCVLEIFLIDVKICNISTDVNKRFCLSQTFPTCTCPVRQGSYFRYPQFVFCSVILKYESIMPCIKD